MGLPFDQRLRYLPVIIVALLVGLVLHEMAHAYTAYLLGDPTAKRMGRLSFNPLKHIDPYGAGLILVTWLAWGFIFGWAKPVPISPFVFRTKVRLRLALIGLAGPVTNFALAIIIAVIWNAVHPAAWGWGFMAFYLSIILMVVLGVFNLLPIPPLDGSRVVAYFLPQKAYQRWAALDQYGMLFVLIVIVAFGRQLSPLFGAAIDGIRDLFVHNYPPDTF